MGYTTTAWLSFGEAVAAVAGALTGLLFVALSVRSDAVSASRSLSSRAAQTLVLFMTSVLVAVLLVAPQPSAALGPELLAVAAVSGTVLIILDRRAGHSTGKGAVRTATRPIRARHSAFRGFRFSPATAPGWSPPPFAAILRRKPSIS